MFKPKLDQFHHSPARSFLTEQRTLYTTTQKDSLDMSEQVKPESPVAPVNAEDTTMADASTSEEKPTTSTPAKENNGRPGKLNVIPRREDAPGTVLPEEDDEKADWDIATPKAEGVYSGMKTEDIEDLLAKAAKQGEWYRRIVD